MNLIENLLLRVRGFYSRRLEIDEQETLSFFDIPDFAGNLNLTKKKVAIFNTAVTVPRQARDPTYLCFQLLKTVISLFMKFALLQFTQVSFNFFLGFL